MNTRRIPARTVALLLLLPLAAGCRDDPGAVLPTEPSPVASAAGSVAAYAYVEIDLGTPDGFGASALGINKFGHVVGSAYSLVDPNDFRAFLWTPAGGMQDLGTPGGLPDEGGWAYDINDSGTVAGVRNVRSAPVGADINPFSRSSTGEWMQLTLPGQTYGEAVAINNKGEIVGWLEGRAFLYRPGLGTVAVELPVPSSWTSRAVDINESSQVLVRSASPDTDEGRLFVVRYPDEVQLVGEGRLLLAGGINNAGWVSGSDFESHRAFVWDPAGGMRYLPGHSHHVGDINDAGQVVGWSYDGIRSGAALWTPDGSGGYALTILGGPGSTASAINAAGEVVGRGNNGRAVLWSPTPPPAAPTNLAARAVSAGRIDLSWTDASDDETSFRVRRATRGSDGLFPPPYQTIATVAAGTTAFSDTAVVVGATYAYAVQACNASGCVYSTPVTVDVPQPPASPAGLSATVVSAGEIGLAWTDASTNEASFLVRRGTRGADGTFPPYQTLATLRRGSTGFADTTTAPGNVYRYQVQACNTTGCAASAAASVEVPLPPAAPTAVSAGVVAGKGVEVGWMDASADETGFRVRRSERRPDGTFAPFQTVGAVGAGVTAFTDATAAGGSTYRYLVQACVDAVCASSASVRVTVPGA